MGNSFSQTSTITQYDRIKKALQNDNHKLVLHWLNSENIELDVDKHSKNLLHLTTKYESWDAVVILVFMYHNIGISPIYLDANKRSPYQYMVMSNKCPYELMYWMIDYFPIIPDIKEVCKIYNKKHCSESNYSLLLFEKLMQAYFNQTNDRADNILEIVPPKAQRILMSIFTPESKRLCANRSNKLDLVAKRKCLRYAVDCGDEMTAIMLARYPDVNAKDVIVSACQQGMKGLVDVLILYHSKRLDLNGKNKCCIMVTCLIKNQEIVLRILNSGVSVDVNYTTTDGMSPLLWCSIHGWVDVAQLLLENPSIKFPKSNKYGDPFIQCCRQNNLVLAQMLIKKFPNFSQNTKDEYGFTAHNYILSNGVPIDNIHSPLESDEVDVPLIQYQHIEY